MADHPSPDLGDPKERAQLVERARRQGYRAQLGVGLGLGLLWVLAALGSISMLARAFR